MPLLAISLTFALHAHATGFIPSKVLCQTEDTKLLREAGEHTFRWTEPVARSVQMGEFVIFEAPDVEAGEAAWHALFSTDKQHAPENYLRLTIPDAGFARCLQLISGSVRVGLVQSREGGAQKLVYAQSPE